MNERVRLEQLREVLMRLERMPASAAREWILREVRARAVDVETGFSPAAMRPLLTDDAAPVAPTPLSIAATPKPASRRPTTQTPRDTPRTTLAEPTPRPAPAATHLRAGHENIVDLLEHAGVLSLNDEPAVTDAESHPWSRGLRG